MKVAALTCHIGAEVQGVGLADAARDDALFGEVKAALLAHKVLFFRDQDITPADHAAFAERFAPLEGHPVVGSHPDHPGLIQIYKDENSPPDHFENAWHCDATWRDAPPMGAVLRCVACPDVGGDTMWANMAKAYADLPPHVKDTIAPLKARHSIEATFGARMPEDRRHALKAQFPDAEHPVVRTHPETGEKVLFVSGFATHFTNFHTSANVRYGQDYAPGGAQLLAYLIGRAAIPEYQVRWRWRPGDVAVWDNRCTQHYAVMDYPPTIRRMERASITGDRPY
ncbi:TauD/TfdA family dioxygenase [Sphingomonas sp. SUN039]|uniref:TauD/TfdA dioxygenase family protein n=1 Tax=Sphingomonas sp. SUN039 TaxID=2937787 RepID=UPI0021641BBB|nr:TauD/TfdA family dioxygenase [Sphingomonas sp. SUN039]UVO54737.1 TauD/TfdA family dioxygenase [Sphingomonas sp. SUN039]